MNNLQLITIFFVVFLLITILIWYLTKIYFEKKITTIEYENELKLGSLQGSYIILKENQENELKHLKEISSVNLSSHEFEIKTLEDKLLDKENIFSEKLELLESSREQMKLEFETLSNRLFLENSKKSTLDLTSVLLPFKEQLSSFGKRVDTIYTDETKQRSSLINELKHLKELNTKISTDAINLTRALKGDNKTQGDWGEMVLSKILEQSGLREGTEYETQGSYQNEQGKRLRPDVILHLPQDKDIIIDSKVSLLAYSNYIEAINEGDKQISQKELVKSIYTHIKGLGLKKYEDLEDIKTLDFVLMFIPIEGAFILASSSDNNLFKTAFENNIMLVSPSTLYATLRTIENIWRYEHQNENALLISKKAADLYDKFASFVKDIEEIGQNINKTQKSYDNAFNKLSSGKGNLIKRSEDFINLGVKARKIINVRKVEQ